MAASSRRRITSAGASPFSLGLETTQIGGGCWSGQQRAHLRARVEADVLVVEEAALERHRARRPELAQYGEAFLEEGAAPHVVEAERLELAPDTLLRVAHPGTEDRAAARDLVERRPLEREIERVPRRRHHARRAELDPRRALRDRSQQRDRLVPGLREEAVSHPHGVEAGAPRPPRRGRAASGGRSRERSAAPGC